MEKDRAVVLELEQDIAKITFNRPESFNAMNTEFFEDFLKILGNIRQMENIRCVVISGSGKAFSAGGDVNFMSKFENPEKEFQAPADHLNSIMLELYTLPKPTVAAINGPAVGAGLSVALACDYRIMSEEAFLMFGYSGIGLTPDGGLSWILPKIIGMSRSMKMVINNPRITADEALAWGLVHEVVPHDSLWKLAMEKAQTITGLAVQAIVTARRLMLEGWYGSLPEQLDKERWSIARAAIGEGREGISAFAEKRKPEFKSVK
ncbi:MAG TPA: enoyl-CoA hydratase/isomerase family protein [Deltaproteobacteria bacterium]|nr:enoyl-CoA hydratase/isomerase family protein [Deltaproteobacteria bacterium]